MDVVTEQEIEDILQDPKELNAIVLEIHDAYASFSKETNIPVIEFHELLVSGDVNKIERILNVLPQEERIFITSACVDYSKSFEDCPVMTGSNNIVITSKRSQNIVWKHIADNILAFKLPLALGAISGSTKVIDLLIKYGARYIQQDINGNNTIHCLVAHAIANPQIACATYNYITSQMNEDEKNLILKCTNKAGCTPLDLAASECVPEMMLAILHTEGVYRFVLKRVGTFSHVMYKLPCKEFQRSKKLSILEYLGCVSEHELHRFEDTNIVDTEPISSLIEAKTNVYTYKRGLLLLLGWHVFL